jgi:hypothetical protein
VVAVVVEDITEFKAEVVLAFPELVAVLVDYITDVVAVV